MTVYMNVRILILLSFFEFSCTGCGQNGQYSQFRTRYTHTYTHIHTHIRFIRTPLAVSPSCIANTCTESRFQRGQQKGDTIVFRPGFANFISSCDHETAIAITVTLGSLSIGYITECCSWREIFATIAALTFYFRAFVSFLFLSILRLRDIID